VLPQPQRVHCGQSQVLVHTYIPRLETSANKNVYGFSLEDNIKMDLKEIVYRSTDWIRISGYGPAAGSSQHDRET
jgi:hypothetical protein